MWQTQFATLGERSGKKEVWVKRTGCLEKKSRSWEKTKPGIGVGCEERETWREVRKSVGDWGWGGRNEAPEVAREKPTQSKAWIRLGSKRRAQRFQAGFRGKSWGI